MKKYEANRLFGTHIDPFILSILSSVGPSFSFHLGSPATTLRSVGFLGYELLCLATLRKRSAFQRFLMICIEICTDLLLNDLLSSPSASFWIADICSFNHYKNDRSWMTRRKQHSTPPLTRYLNPEYVLRLTWLQQPEGYRFLVEDF